MPPSALLPTEKTPVTVDPLSRKILLYGDKKIGKSTLSNELDERVLFLATEPGHDHLELFRVPIKTWQDFLNVGKDLQNNPEHGFSLVVVDTVDELARMCVDYVVDGLADTAKLNKDRY